ncbi:heat shock factor protein 1 isoform X1 [Diorhabda carinulata]|uniref:heat shock factor protein 1 isoform X1 n=1 Tax=Diorhabda carinulata TaxID=1163345 RepID=UPI0025A200DC|nr:heat shock factor protein 1 isoform X1 [Diorhabda carinulata]
MEENVSEVPFSGADIKQERSEEGVPQISTTIPLFIKKLWKMVNDLDAENIISWNDKGDGFIIHDQLEFITKLLPYFFKHNNMASFVRQLNFYNFHKVPSTKNDIEFSHECFLRDMPELLPYIRRKIPIIKSKPETTYKGKEVEELLRDVKNLKGKHSLVDKELAMLKRENVALWRELNSLRVKYTKQSTIINMLIHFLITYIHSHQSAFSKQNIQVSADQRSGNIRPRPTLLEIGYKNPRKTTSKNYSILQPGTSNSVTYSLKLPKNCGPDIKRQRTTGPDINKMLSVEDQVGLSSMNRMKKSQRPGITYSIKLPGQNDQLNQSDIQRSLLNILKENEQLCEEDNNDVITELDSEYDHLDEQEEMQDVMYDTADEITAEGSPGYTVSYPNENPDELYTQVSAAEEPIPESPQEYVDINEQESKYDNPKILMKKVPIKLGSNLTNYTITHPNLENFDQKVIKQPINIVDHVLVPNNNQQMVQTVPKLPVKNVNVANTTLGKNKKILKVPQKSGKPKAMKMAASPQSNNMVNAEGTLLEILKENEKLKNDELNIQSSDMNVQKSNLENLINDVQMGEAFENFYPDDADTSEKDPVIDIRPQSQQPISNTDKNIKKESSTFNILANPKEHLSTYVDNTQEEIDMLQDILNDLTSKDLSEILNSQSSQMPINVDDFLVVEDDVDNNESVKETEVEKSETNNEYNYDESVDKYFKKHFLDF